MLKFINKRFQRLCSRLNWPVRRRSKTKIVTRTLGKSNSKSRGSESKIDGSATVHPNGHISSNSKSDNTIIRVATFNASLFSMASVVAPKSDFQFDKRIIRAKSVNDQPKGILKQSPLHPNATESLTKQEKFAKSKLRVSINLPDNEISLLRNRQSSFREEGTSNIGRILAPLRASVSFSSSPASVSGDDDHRNRQLSFREEGESNIGRIIAPLKASASFSFSPPAAAAVTVNGGRDHRSRHLSFREDGTSNIERILAPLRASVSFSSSQAATVSGSGERFRSGGKTVVEVLRELNADILALQDVKADEEKEMKPLSDLAAALGMNYVFAESWAPEYGNAVLSKWPIKKSKVQKIFDDSDFRNVLKATIDVPQVGEVNFHCTLLDHLDENWRMKQINVIINASDGDGPHILAGGLNSLDKTDYSQERWTDIVKYYEEMGKPTPKAEVMKFLKSKHYTDAKDFTGECESVVMITKGQSVQGTCKYGTRVDYIMASPNSTYKFIPGSYSVYSSKGTSDHHIVKVDVVKVLNSCNAHENVGIKMRGQSKKLKVVKITNSSSTQKGIWKIQQNAKE